MNLCQARELCLSMGVGLYESITPRMEARMAPLPGGGEEIRVYPRFLETVKTVNFKFLLELVGDGLLPGRLVVGQVLEGGVNIIKVKKAPPW